LSKHRKEQLVREEENRQGHIDIDNEIYDDSSSSSSSSSSESSACSISIPPPPLPASSVVPTAKDVRASTTKLFNIIHAHKAPKVIATSFIDYITTELVPLIPPDLHASIPKSLAEMEKEIEHVLPGAIKIHACPGHVLYRGAYASSLSCPVCKKARFEEDTDEYNSRLNLAVSDIAAAAAAAGSPPPPQAAELNLKQKLNNFTPRFVLYYMPIIPRLKALIAHPVFSHLFRYADTHMQSGDDEMVRSFSSLSPFCFSLCLALFSGMFVWA
jgi:hypothetical protein